MDINNLLNQIVDKCYIPKIGILGKTGVGKSSLCNALIGKNLCEVNDIVACTREIKELDLDVGDKKIKFIDVPGIGENLTTDAEYGVMYAKLLPELDFVLWLFKSDERTYSSDEQFYKNIVKPHFDKHYSGTKKPFLFVVNQVDKIEPIMDWNSSEYKPGYIQQQNINKKIKNISEIFNCSTNNIVAISAKENYNLDVLLNSIFLLLPDAKLSSDSQDTSYGSFSYNIIVEDIAEIVENTFDKIEAVGRTLEKAGDEVVEVMGETLDNIVDWFKSKF
jgi:small GTP-binding protein